MRPKMLVGEVHERIETGVIVGSCLPQQFFGKCQQFRPIEKDPINLQFGEKHRFAHRFVKHLQRFEKWKERTCRQRLTQILQLMGGF